MPRNDASMVRSKVNFYVCIVFVAVFGLFATQTVLRASGHDDPIGNTIAATAGYNEQLSQDLGN